MFQQQVDAFVSEYLGEDETEAIASEAVYRQWGSCDSEYHNRLPVDNREDQLSEIDNRIDAVSEIELHSSDSLSHDISECNGGNATQDISGEFIL